MMCYSCSPTGKLIISTLWINNYQIYDTGTSSSPNRLRKHILQQKITDNTQLTAFLRGLKEDMNKHTKSARSERLSLEEIREKELSEVSKRLSQHDNVRPVYDLKDYSHPDVLDKLKAHLGEIIENTFDLKDLISDIQQTLCGINSQIVAAVETKEKS